jgi:hypothetical protein
LKAGLLTQLIPIVILRAAEGRTGASKRDAWNGWVLGSAAADGAASLAG